VWKASAVALVADFRPRRVVHVDLAEGLPDSEIGDDGDFLYVVLWWRDLPLGHLEAVSDVFRYPHAVDLVARAIAPAVGDWLYQTGKNGDPAPDAPSAGSMFQEGRLLSLVSPLARLDECLGRLSTPSNDVNASVVVCTRDRPLQLRRCLSSIATSTVAPLEVIVVDNAPGGGSTRQVVEAFPGVRYVPEPRPGLSVARNTAIEQAVGEIVAFTDDDATVHPQWLRRLLEGFRQPHVMAVTGLVLPEELATESQVVFEKALGGFNHGYRSMVFGRDFFEKSKTIAVPVWKIGAGANMALRRQAYDLAGPFDERLGAGATGCSEDSEFWYRLLALGWECRYQPGAVVFHRHRTDRLSLQRQARDYVRGHVAALFVQFSRFRHWGNMRRALLALPRSLLLQGVKELSGRLETPGEPAGDTSIFGAKVSGYLQGLALLPLAFRATPSGPDAQLQPSSCPSRR
jgi:GT2 family glycosyltransferase